MLLAVGDWHIVDKRKMFEKILGGMCGSRRKKTGRGAGHGTSCG
jgi:hypothetical protein